MEFSPRLNLSYLSPQQAQKHVTVNETFRRLDQLVQLSVLSRTISAQPASPVDGDAYILPAAAAGSSWAGFADNSIAAYQDGAWKEIVPKEGWRAWVCDVDEQAVFNGTLWSNCGEGGSTIRKFGVNTTADATNRLAVKSDAALFNHDDATPGTGDVRVFVNKGALANTGSLIFQDGASGRAEIGLIGNDNLSVRVSADGAVWTSALAVDRTNGNVGVGTSAPRQLLEVAGFVGISSVTPGFFLNESDGAADAFLVLDNGTLQIQRRASGYGAFQAQVISFSLTNGVIVGSPTGSFKGAGTLNAVAVYDDNALLSCYVFDAALDGRIDLGKWDAKTPSGRHDGARRFAARLGADHDPLTLDGYAAHWREKRHLCAMPNEAGFEGKTGNLSTGEWIQRLVETVEVQAVLIEALNQRLKAIECV